MRCVVCGKPVADGDEQYANTWERSRRRFPCCSPACTADFDPDRHWIPARPPAPPDDTDAAVMTSRARGRLLAFDEPGPIVRELLQAGLAPRVVAGLVTRARIAAETTRAETRSRTRRTVWRLLLGRLTIAGPGPTVPDDRLYDAALDDVEAWQRASDANHEASDG